jgi:1-acyl-sn-glycerol-3-phosphate acyltransferase
MSFLYWAGWTAYRFSFASYFRWKVFNPERVPLTGGVILASNHASYLDPPLIGSGIHREINYLARESLFRYPLLGKILHEVRAVPVDRDGGGAAGLRSILERLLAGQAILLFPEGTRTTTGALQPARPGIGLTVVKSTAPVIPVRVFGTFEAFGKPHCFPRPRQVMVKYGEPMEFRELRAEAESCSRARLKEIYGLITEQIMDQIGRLRPHADVPRFPPR